MTVLKRADKVEWNTPQGPTTVAVVRRATATAHVQGRVSKASPAHPEVEVRSEESGPRAVHRAGALRQAG